MRAASGFTGSLLLVLCCGLNAFAQGTYTQTDDPDAYDTYPVGINSAGDIVGFINDAKGQHGFILSGGEYTIIDYPSTTDLTELSAINDHGQAIGIEGGFGLFFAFLYDVPTQSFTKLAPAGANTSLSGGINNSGVISGSYYNPELGLIGFAYKDLTFSSFKVPGVEYTYVTGISDNNVLVGYVDTITHRLRPLLFKNGELFTPKIPGVPDAALSGIDPQGSTLVGYCQVAPDTYSGFVYRNHATEMINFPGASSTVVGGVNSAGTVVGHFTDSTRTEHGFIWTP